jgi:sterol desaturase/sphingolipid hydroxylase (fatty acid hydroxylase superfamily)
VPFLIVIHAETIDPPQKDTGMDTIITLALESGQNLWTAFKYLFVPGLVFLIVAILFKGKGWLTDVRRALPEFGLTLKIIVFNVLIGVPVVAVILTAAHSVILQNQLMLFTPEAWTAAPVALMLFLAVFMGDFFHYWRHRLDHSALLWPAHAVHHSDTEVTWLTAMRWHPINLLTMKFVGEATMLLMGMPVYAILFNRMLRGYYGYFIHADLPWTYGWLGKVMVSPAMHRWHHSAEEKAFDKNFGEFFCVFDRAFGTYYLPGPCEGPLGVADDMQPTLQSQIGYAFTAKAYRPFLRRLRARLPGGRLAAGE